MSEITDLSYFDDVSPSNPNPQLADSWVHPNPGSVPAVLELPDTLTEESTLVPTVPSALRNIDLSKCATRADFMKGLARNIPTNEFNLPLFIYRADLISPPVISVDAEEQFDYSQLSNMLDAAQVQLTYDQGFPTIANGQPIWAQLEYEDRKSFDAFLQYLDQPGARLLTDIISEPLDLLTNWYVLNFWNVRALAYDMFKIAHHQRLREHRILALNDKHYIEGERAFNKLASVLGDKLNDTEQMKEMSIPEIVSALEKMGKIQRLAAGLSTTGGKDEPPKQTTSVEVITREISQSSNPGRRDNEDSDISELLANPDLLNKAQELIIRVQNK